MGIWAELDRDAAEARVRELWPKINDDIEARAEHTRLMALLAGKEDDDYVMAWRSTLH